MDEPFATVARLRQPGCSRNRSFDELSTPTARRAMRIHRWLLGLERELRSGAEVALEAVPAGYRLRLGFPALRVAHVANLRPEEMDLLRAVPGLSALLESGMRQAPASDAPGPGAPEIPGLRAGPKASL